MRKLKVCWISNAPAPYKVAFMNELAKKVDLLCLFESKIEHEHDRQKSWYAYENQNFKSIYLDEVDAKKIVKQASIDCDCLINSDYTKRICVYAVKQFHKRNKLSFMHADGGLAIPRGFMDFVISKFMKKNDYFLSSGSVTNQYYEYYKIDSKRIYQYHFACMDQKELDANKMLIKKKDELRKSHNMNEAFIVLSVGQQIPRKGYDVLVKAMSNVDQSVGLYIVGGTAEECNEAYIKEHSLKNVHFIPFLEKDKLKEYYASADLFVLPTRYDIWGLVINEAMSFGLPIISTDHCMAAVEFNRLYKNAIIVPIEDENAIANAIHTLKNDTLQTKTLAERSLQNISLYSYETMAEDFYKILNDLVRG